MTRFALRAAMIVGAAGDHADAWLMVGSDGIEAIGAEAPAGVPQLDLGDTWIAPGLIDLHIHGRDGRDVMDADPESLRAIARSLARHGVTGFLATTVTGGWERTLAALRVAGDLTGAPMPGARLLGAYSEGLFFSCKHKGAHNDAFFLPPTVERLDAMIAAASGELRVLALAPEIDGATEVVRHAVAQGIRVVLGHTDASYDQTRAALALGASGGVHLFNGMRGIHHREPGCAGALLLERCAVEVIADGVHLHDAMLDLIARLKRPDDILLISDCMCAGGLAEGRYWLGETEVTVAGGVVSTDAGGLAGSTLTLDAAVRRMADAAGMPFGDVLRMAARSPARFLGIDDRLGGIAAGKLADLVILDAGRRVRATLVGGQLVHADPGWEQGTALAALAGRAE